MQLHAAPQSAFAIWRRLRAAGAPHDAIVTWVALAMALAVVGLAWVTSRSFLNPTDAYVYLAAGERLNAGHALYALMPGDRDVLLNPPYWTVPFLSPPLMGVLWKPLALLGDAGIGVGWAIATVAYLAALAVLVRGLPVWGALAVAILAPNIGAQLAIGNVNGLLALALLGLWLLRERPWLAGLIVALMISVKVTPVVLVLWLLATGRLRAVATTAVWFIALAGVSVLIAGWDAHVEYLGVATQTMGDGTTNASVAGVLREFGLDAATARFVPWLLLAAGAALMVRWRSHAGIAFAVAVVMMTVGSPSFNPYWFALTLFGLIPFATQRRAANP